MKDNNDLHTQVGCMVPVGEHVLCEHYVRAHVCALPLFIDNFYWCLNVFFVYVKEIQHRIS